MKKSYKDVLFIIHDVHQEDNQFPLNIGYLAAVLEQNNYSVEVYCMDVFHYTNEDLIEKPKVSKYKKQRDIIDRFYNLYFKKIYGFRGARNYEKR